MKIQELYQTPVIYVTAYGDKKTSTNQNIEPPAGIGYIVKPFTEAELAGEISRLIN